MIRKMIALCLVLTAVSVAFSGCDNKKAVEPNTPSAEVEGHNHSHGHDHEH